MTPRRSRTFWPAPLTHEDITSLPDPPKRSGRNFALLYACVVLLVLVNVALLAFILSRSAYRDAQNKRIQDEIRNSWCTALDTFPEGGFALDRLRDQYDCGPGRPIADLPPEEQKELAGRGRANVTPPVEVESPADTFAPGPPRDDVEPPPMAWPPEAAPEAPADQPEPTVPIPDGFPPPDPVQPLTETACGVVGVCP